MKFIQVTYGSSKNSDKQRYVYLANDNVRVGDTVRPAFRHYKSKEICGTTAVIQATSKLGAKGQQADEMREYIESGGAINREGEGRAYLGSDLRVVYTGADLGIERQKDEKGKFIGDKSRHIKVVVKKGKQYLVEEQYEIGAYGQATLDANKKLSKQQGTFDGTTLDENLQRNKPQNLPKEPQMKDNPYVNVQTKQSSGAEARLLKPDNAYLNEYRNNKESEEE